jgi:hypothetical protein
MTNGRKEAGMEAEEVKRQEWNGMERAGRKGMKQEAGKKWKEGRKDRAAVSANGQGNRSKTI